MPATINQEAQTGTNARELGAGHHGAKGFPNPICSHKDGAVTAQGDSAPGHWTSFPGCFPRGRVCVSCLSSPNSHACIIPRDFQWQLSALRDGCMELLVLLMLLQGWGGGALVGFTN